MELTSQGQKQVYIRCNIKKIDKINSVKEEFWCAFSITKCWKDNTIPQNLEKYVNDTEPKIYISNLIKTNYIYVSYDTFLVGQQQFIEKTENYFSKLKGNFNFHKFPCDIQKLNINIISREPSTKVKLVQSPHHISLLSAHDTFQRKHEWNIYSPLNVIVKETNNSNSTKNLTYSSLDFVFSIKRSLKNYFWNIIFLNFLIALSSFSTYSIEYENSADRLNVSGMLLLTKVAFKQVQNTLTPNISYLTLIDKYIFCGLAFLFIVMIQNSVAIFMSQNFDNYSFFFLVGLFVLYNSVFAIRFLKA